ncbi:hypothetical protein [Owenweeksia hongkongensis]|uniref:hypothetical protein n=1 Tax=Owenweeksia hongkongensis TaxID=253245 RepID=UPI003A8CBD17
MTHQPNLTGHALLLGVSEVDPQHYHFKKPLECALDDVQGMAKLLESTKLYPKDNIRPLIKKDATSHNFFSELKRLSELSKSEDIFLVVYITCHGVFMPKDEHDGRCEMLCLYDQIIMEQQLHELLTDFSENSKIVVVIDSCYSGGVDDLKEFVDTIDYSQFKVIEEKERKSVLQQHWKNLYKDLIAKHLRKQYDFNTETCFLMACEKRQLALIGKNGSPSYYTDKLLNSFEQLPELGNYYAFQNWLKRHSKPEHSPKITVRVKKEPSHFYQYEPFKFRTMTNKEVITDRRWKIETEEVQDKPIVYLLSPSSGNFECIFEDVIRDGDILKTTLEVVEVSGNVSYPLRIKSERVDSDKGGLFDHCEISIKNRSVGNRIEGRNKTKGRVRNHIGGGGQEPGNS